MQLLFYNKVVFTRKYVPLYPNIRLLERDEWGVPPFSAYLSCGYCSTKTQKPIGKNIIELPRSVTKGLVACRDTALGVYFDITDGKNLRQH